MTTVVHCKKSVYDIYVGRPSVWGNPFVIGVHGTREEVVAKYEAWVKTQPKLMATIPTLKGKMLSCWCHPQACHADVLARLADELDKEKGHP